MRESDQREELIDREAVWRQPFTWSTENSSSPVWLLHTGVKLCCMIGLYIKLRKEVGRRWERISIASVCFASILTLSRPHLGDIFCGTTLLRGNCSHWLIYRRISYISNIITYMVYQRQLGMYTSMFTYIQFSESSLMVSSLARVVDWVYIQLDWFVRSISVWTFNPVSKQQEGATRIVCVAPE